MIEPEEPASAEQARAWVAERLLRADPFAEVAAATERHRAEHGCDAYASGDGALLGVMARSVRARRILEVGTGLGYSACWLAHGAPDAVIETMEADRGHAALAEETLRRLGFSERVRVHLGRSPDALGTLAPGYDVLVYDAAVPTPAELARFHDLLRPGGLLLSSNLFLGQYGSQIPGLSGGAEFRRLLFEPTRWFTGFAGLKAVSVRV